MRMIRMRYLLLIIVLKQLLCDAASKQQDLENKPTISEYLANEFFFSNTPPVNIGNRLPQNVRRNSPISNVDTNYNTPNSKLYETLISYYNNLTPFIEDSVQENIKLSDEHNSNFIIDQRSRNLINSNYNTPVELHHGYRYIDPAISFSNYTNLSNVIYNELGLSENHNSIKSSGKGFKLQEPLKENHTKSNIFLESADNMPDVSSNINVNYRNSSNITVLLPVKNLIFSSNYSQPYESSSNSKEQNSVKQLSSKYSVKSRDTIRNIFTRNPVFNSISNLNLLQSAQISQDFQKANMKNISIHTRKELSQNIKPNVESIIPRNVSSKLSTNSQLKLNELATNYPQIENKFMCGHYSQIQIHEYLQKPFKGNLMVNKTYNPTIVNNFNRLQNVESAHNVDISDSTKYENFNKTPQQTNRDEPLIEFSHKISATIQQNPLQNIYINSIPDQNFQNYTPELLDSQHHSKLANNIFNNGDNILNPITKEFKNFASNEKGDKNQSNKIIFPTNIFSFDSSKIPAKFNNQHFKIQGSDANTPFNTKTPIRYHEQNIRSPFINYNKKDNKFNINYINRIKPDQLLQLNERIPINLYYLNQYRDINTLNDQIDPRVQLRAEAAIENGQLGSLEQIDPRATNYWKDSIEQLRFGPEIANEGIIPTIVKHQDEQFLNAKNILNGFKFPSHSMQTKINKSPKQNEQQEKSAIFPKSLKEKLRTPHLIYGSPI